MDEQEFGWVVRVAVPLWAVLLVLVLVAGAR